MDARASEMYSERPSLMADCMRSTADVFAAWIASGVGEPSTAFSAAKDAAKALRGSWTNWPDRASAEALTADEELARPETPLCGAFCSWPDGDGALKAGAAYPPPYAQA
jgi:hypothetical protein